MKPPNKTPERRLELVHLASDRVKELLCGAVGLGIQDGEMREYWALLTTAVLTLGASMEGAEWMENVVKNAVEAAKHDFDQQQTKQAGRN